MPKPRKVRCPKCGAKPAYYLETWTTQYEFDAGEDGLPKVDGEGGLANGQLLDAADPIGVDAICGKCFHQWRVRKVHQITSLLPS